MNRQGKVIALEGDLARVQLIRHEACDHCNACELGQEESTKVIEVEALNTLGAETGALVEIDMADQNVLMAAFIAYTIPLIVLITTLVVSTTLLKFTSFAGQAEVISAILSIVTTAITYVVIKKNDHRFKKSGNYLASIVKIVARREL